jgi:pimeloyl-ACP methyl ester carboxylesterase
MLRSKQVHGPTFKHIIGVGHSYGSALTTSIASMYPEDLDAVILTGFSSSNITGATQFATSLNLVPAASVPAVSGRFLASLPDGYLIPSTQYGVQCSFFHYPNFEPSILSRTFTTTQTTTVGDQLTMDTVGQKATHYNESVYVINGEYDLFFCDGNFSYPIDLSEATLREVFPRANEKASDSLILPLAGHGLKLGFIAAHAFFHIQKFVTKSGL